MKGYPAVDFIDRRNSMETIAAEPRTLVVEIARTAEDVLAAQRLRHEVFAVEMGARVIGGEQGLDVDRYDPHCTHLLVREGAGGRVVACLRLLDGESAMRAGGYYSQAEFDMTRVLIQPGLMLEVGRTCVARDRRDGATLSALWSGLAREALARGAEHLIGCASVPFDPETEALSPLARSLQAYWTGDDMRVFPRRPVPRDASQPSSQTRMPALLGAYLRLGARVCGEPSWDPEFGTADFFMLVSVRRLAARYARRYFGQEESSCAS
jgi:putative hemolysin